MDGAGASANREQRLLFCKLARIRRALPTGRVLIMVTRYGGFDDDDLRDLPLRLPEYIEFFPGMVI
jgi:hypothetical protein